MRFWHPEEGSWKNDGLVYTNQRESGFPAHLYAGQVVCVAGGRDLCFEKPQPERARGHYDGEKDRQCRQAQQLAQDYREAFRQAAPQVREGFDFVLVARGRTPFVKSTDIYRVLMRQLKDAGVLK